MATATLLPPQTELNTGTQPFPHRVELENIAIDAFSDIPSLFERLLYETNRSTKSVFAAVNIQIMNTAFENPEIREFLQNSQVVYCDGAGVVVGSKLLHDKEDAITGRITAADWMFELWEYLAYNQKTIYYLGGEPGIIEEALIRYTEAKPDKPCPVVGYHHGYILNDAALENAVIEDINRIKPDLLIVAMGCPLQELWINRNMHRINAGVFYPIGATLDYLTEKVQRCPQWMGEAGIEWVWRLGLEPRRMFRRYVLGNPYFMARMYIQWINKQIFGKKPATYPPMHTPS